MSLELSFLNSNLQFLKEELSDLNSSVDIYQNDERYAGSGSYDELCICGFITFSYVGLTYTPLWLLGSGTGARVYPLGFSLYRIKFRQIGYNFFEKMSFS